MANSSFNIDPTALIEGDIFEMVGLTNLTDQQKQDLLVKFSGMISNRVVMRIADALEPSVKQQWDDLIATDKNQEAEALLVANGLKINELAAQEALALKAQLVSMSHTLTNPQ